MFANIHKLSVVLCMVSSMFVLPIGSTMCGVMLAADSVEGVITPGNTAPDFTLPDADGKNCKLADLRGKFVVLEWFNDGCPFVKKHYDSENMQKLQKTYTKKGVTWLSVVSSAPGKQGYHSGKELKAIMRERNASPSAVLIDEDGQVGRLYGAKTTPQMFVINPRRILVYAGAIDDKPDTDAGSIGKAKNYLKEALDKSLAGKEVAISSTKPYGCSVKY